MICNAQRLITGVAYNICECESLKVRKVVVNVQFVLLLLLLLLLLLIIIILLLLSLLFYYYIWLEIFTLTCYT